MEKDKKQLNVHIKMMRSGDCPSCNKHTAKPNYSGIHESYSCSKCGYTIVIQ